MNPFKQYDEYASRHDSGRLHAAVRDFASYPQWWPQRFKIDPHVVTDSGVGSQAIISPMPALKVIWELEEVTKDTIKINYLQSPHTGWGLWRFKPSNGGTLVSYEIELNARNLFFEIGYTVFSVTRIHSGHMKSLFESLENHLNR